jgi:hypothetical protein
MAIKFLEDGVELSELPFGLATPDAFAYIPVSDIFALGKDEPDLAEEMVLGSGDGITWSILESARSNPWVERITSIRWSPNLNPCDEDYGYPTGEIPIWTNTGNTVLLPPPDEEKALVFIPGVGVDWQTLELNKVKVSSNDIAPNYLLNKLAAVSPVVITELNDGGNETLQISLGSGLAYPPPSKASVNGTIYNDIEAAYAAASAGQEVLLGAGAHILTTLTLTKQLHWIGSSKETTFIQFSTNILTIGSGAANSTFKGITIERTDGGDVMASDGDIIFDFCSWKAFGFGSDLFTLTGGTKAYLNYCEGLIGNIVNNNDSSTIYILGGRYAEDGSFQALGLGSAILLSGPHIVTVPINIIEGIGGLVLGTIFRATNGDMQLVSVSLYLDEDADTRILASGDDTIRFDTGGADRVIIDNGGLLLEQGVSINEFSSDGTLAGNSDIAVPTEKAVRTFVLNQQAVLRVRRSADQTNIPTVTITQIQFDVEDFDTMGAYNTGTYRYTPTRAGKYAVYLQVRVNSQLAGSYVEARIGKNGATSNSVFRLTFDAAVSVAVVPTFDVLSMNGTTDYIEFFVQHNNEVNKDVDGSGTYTHAHVYYLGNP